MLFGDPSTFAIEASSDEQTKSSGVWGRMRVFCQGHPMGNLAEGNCSLFPAYQGFDQVLARLREGSLQHKSINGLDHASSHRVLAQALFGEWSDNSECAPDELWDHSLLNNWGPQFDDVPLTFIRSSGGSVVISQERSDNSTAISLFTIPTDAMLYALDEFCCWYEMQEQACAHPQ
jgi:hypothetical protein